MYSLCKFPQTHLTELLEKDLHYIDRDDKFFSKSPIDNVLMWRRRIEICINNKSPSTITTSQSKNSIKRHFRITRKRKKVGRPKTIVKKKSSSNTKSKTTDNTKREKTHQSSMTTFLIIQKKTTMIL